MQLGQNSTVMFVEKTSIELQTPDDTKQSKVKFHRRAKEPTRRSHQKEEFVSKNWKVWDNLKDNTNNFILPEGPCTVLHPRSFQSKQLG